VPAVARIDDAILECSIYLYPNEGAALTGEQMGGSGFLVTVPLIDNPESPQRRHVSVERPPENLGSSRIHQVYAVTNAHVIRGGGEYIRINTTDGSFDVIRAQQSLWTFHQDGDDLAVFALHPSQSHKARMILADVLITEQIIENWKVGIGDETFTVGRFINHDGQAEKYSIGPLRQYLHDAVRANPRQERIGADVFLSRGEVT
jgi:hypothetical protein